jgi:hypothetical protein
MRSFQVLVLDRSSFQKRGMNEELPGIEAGQEQLPAEASRRGASRYKGWT